MGLVAESISRSAIRAYREFEVVVRVRLKKLYPALKHGGYSATGLLPGEDPAAFEKLHRDLISELCPDGPLQEDTVFDIARLMWRKQNLGTFRVAEAARERASAISSEMVPSTTPPIDPYINQFSDWSPPDPADREAAKEAAEAQARKELGENYKFVEMGDLATATQMLADLEVEERLNAMIDKLLKRLWMLQASKSLSSTASSTTLPRLSGPKKAA
jgi:hypothetical protein